MCPCPVCPPAQPRPADADFGRTLAQRALTWHQQPGEAATLEAIDGADTPRLLRGADAAACDRVYVRDAADRTADGPIERRHAALPRTLTPNQ